jgi:hypothetical protein
MPKGNKKFLTYLNNMLAQGALHAIKSKRGMLLGRWTYTTVANVRSDLHKWKLRIGLTKVDRKYWGQKP